MTSRETPEWVTLALVPHIPKRITNICEPAAGSGKMVRALERAGYLVTSNDIEGGCDFLQFGALEVCDQEAIITNPPYIFSNILAEVEEGEKLVINPLNKEFAFIWW